MRNREYVFSFALKSYNTNYLSNILGKIPQLKPSEFDDYIFSNWKPIVASFYDNFHIERIENYAKHLNLPILPHRRSVNFFIFVTKGLVIRSRGLTKYEIKENSFFCLSADQITSLEYVSDDVEGFYCHFKSEVFSDSTLKSDLENEFPFFQLTTEPIIEVDNPERFIQLLRILENEYKKSQIERWELIPQYLHILFSELKLTISNDSKSTINAASLLTQRYKNALSKNIYELKTVIEFADLLSISPNHLNKCVKLTVGKSAHELLEEMRILEAKVLLKQTDLSIAEIAFKIGKFEPSDFTRFFKSKTSLTPKQYRLHNI